MSNCYNQRLQRDLANLSVAFPLLVGDESEFVIVRDVRLPAGYNRTSIDLLLELPPDYPISPPGIGSYRAYIRPGLRYRGHDLEDLHTFQTPDVDTPGFAPWAWLCYQRIDWQPHRDDLIKFVEMVRADLSQPKTKRSLWNLL